MDISSLRERNTHTEYSVSELNAYIKRLFDNDRILNAISVKGEISNFTYHRTGHLYFTLKDEDSQLRAVMFRSSASSLKFMPENGMKVIVRGSVNVYSQSGNYQIYVNSMQPDGIGALYMAYEQLKQKLGAEGLFSDEYKRELPAYPQKIGVITSPTGAAVRDIINVTGRRFPLAELYLYPSLVQGDGAESNLIEALDYFEATQLVDVIIIGRGGGSIEDLWAFNSEKLARRIFSCTIPIISAVGHETDFTICDFVSDLRAPTPSAAAEVAVPDTKEFQLRLSAFYDRCEASLIRICEKREERLTALKAKRIFVDTDELFSSQNENVTELKERIKYLMENIIAQKTSNLAIACGKVNALSPLATLSRGYSIATGESGIIKNASDINTGDEICLRVLDGEIFAEVKKIKEIKNG